jgi:quinol monooxygenase YgiN
MNISELDDLVAAVGLPVRPQTLTEVWDSTALTDVGALPRGQVLALITMRARPGMEEQLGDAARSFVQSSGVAPGAISSTLHRSIADKGRWFLVERFADDSAFGRHMASDYFRIFQTAQASLIAEPVQAIFLAGRA